MRSWNRVDGMVWQRPNRRIVVWLAAFVIILAGCGPGTEKSAPDSGLHAESEEQVSWTLIASGDTDGFIVPCGCASKQYGGLLRRATYVKERTSSDPNVLYVDLGGSVARATDYDALKLTYIWKGLQAMKVTACNIGSGELALGAARLRTLAEVGVPLVSANVRVTDGKAPPWKSYRTCTVGGKRIVFTGVVVPEGSIGDGLTAVDAEPALRSILPECSSADAVVLLVYGNEEACHRLMETFPECTVVLAAGTKQPVAPRWILDRTLFASTTQKGKFLARMVLEGRRLDWHLKEGGIAELAENFADDEGQSANLEAYKSALREAKFDPARTGEGARLLDGLPSGYRYAGTAACASCHAEDARIHRESHHAHALETLAGKRFDYDPYCLKCHTTGYGAAGGFATAEATPASGGVGCESCHGPSQAHAIEPRIKTSVGGRSACISCHDPENSPHFEFSKYWSKIRHGPRRDSRPPEAGKETP